MTFIEIMVIMRFLTKHLLYNSNYHANKLLEN